RVTVLRELGSGVLFEQGRFQDAIGRLNDAVATARAIDDERSLALSLRFRARLFRHDSLVGPADNDLTEAMVILLTLDEPYWVAMCQSDLANVRVRQQRLQEAESLAREAEIALRGLGAHRELAGVLNDL